jgi:hypothetical protein
MGKKPGPGPRFFASVSLYLVVVPRFADIPDVEIVRAQHIGRNSTGSFGSSGGLGGVMGMVVLRSQGGAGENERGRGGQNKKSHGRILLFVFES